MRTLVLLPFLLAPSPSSPQSSFSPFSLLNSFFSNPPPWAQLAPAPRERRKPKPQKVFFRPHQSLAPAPPKGPSFSASQQVPQIVRLHHQSRGNRHPASNSISVNPTQIIRITEPSKNFQTRPTPLTIPAPLTTRAPLTTPSPPETTIRSIKQVSNSLDSSGNQVEVVYPSNTQAAVTEQSSFSSFPSRDSGLSGPNPEDFPIISLIDQGPNNYNYYDEVFHLTVPSILSPQPSNRVVNPYYSPEEFAYNQDPIDLDLVHGSGPQVREVVTNYVAGFTQYNEIEDGDGVEFPKLPRGKDSDSVRKEEKKFETLPSPLPIHSLPPTSPTPTSVSHSTNSTSTFTVSTKSFASSSSSAPASTTFSVNPSLPPFTSTVSRLLSSIPASPSSTFPIPPIPTHPPTSTPESPSYSSLFSPTTPSSSPPTPSPSPYTTTSSPSSPSTPSPSPSPRGSPDSVDFSPSLSSLQAGKEARRVRLVTTVEYRASDRREGGREEGGSNSSLSSLVRRECAGRGETWCAVTPSYPTARVEERVAACGQVLDSYRAVLSQDLALLGDNSASVISSEKDKERPWSWKVYAYKKRQVCSSDLYFLEPGVARDTEGSWRVVLQLPSLVQRVAVDICHSPDSPCPGLSLCGSKSRCVQRYNHQLLLTVPDFPTDSCPQLRAFTFPTGCVCHAETQGEG